MTDIASTPQKGGLSGKLMGTAFALCMYSLPGFLFYYADKAFNPPHWILAATAAVLLSLLFRKYDRG